MILRGVPTFLILLAAVSAAAFVLAGCGEDEAAGLGGELSYVRSGGIAGAHDELVVFPTGRATLRTRKGEREFRLTEAEMARLAEEASGLESVNAVAPRPAPDAFVYTVVYKDQTAVTDDPSLGQSDFKPLVVQLEKILQAHGG